MLIMMWQTFPLRYGLVGRLFGEFRWTFVIILGFICKLLYYIGLSAAERGYKLSIVAATQDTFNEQDLFINQGYTFLYYARFLLYPVFYAVLINFSLRIIDPIYYKPNKWIN